MLKRSFLIVLFLLPVVGILLLTRVLDPDLVARLTGEDALIENLSASFYLAGFCLCFYRLVVLGQQPRTALVLWMFLCFVFFGEETSWLQRVIGFETPPGIENSQDEFNLHNLEMLQNLVTTDEGYPVLGSQNLFRAGFVFYFVVFPLLAILPPFSWARKLHAYPLPGWTFVATVSATILITLSFSALAVTRVVKSAIGEIHELFFAFIILSYILRYLQLPVAVPAECRERGGESPTAGVKPTWE